MSANSLSILLVAALLTCAWPPAPVRAADEPVAAHRPVGDLARESFREVLDRRCTICHSLARVEAARAAGRDLQQLTEQMVARGASIDPADRAVLGTFWGSPTQSPDVPAPAQGAAIDRATYRQFEEIITLRCTLCHTRERIDAAIARQDSLAAIEEMMLKRGAVLTQQERSILRIFWETPHR